MKFSKRRAIDSPGQPPGIGGASSNAPLWGGLGVGGGMAGKYSGKGRVTTLESSTSGWPSKVWRSSMAGASRFSAATLIRICEEHGGLVLNRI